MSRNWLLFWIPFVSGSIIFTVATISATAPQKQHCAVGLSSSASPISHSVRVSKEESTAAKARRLEILTRFGKFNGFSCDYTEQEHGHNAGVIVSDDGSRHRITHKVSGQLVVASAIRLRIDLEKHHQTYDKRETIQIAADGHHAWRWGRPFYANGDQITVLKDRIVEPNTSLTEESRQALIRGDIAVSRGYDITQDFRHLFVLSPLAGISTERLLYRGEEMLDGEKVWHFSCLQGKRSPRSEHWLGADDGVPRRIDICNHDGRLVTTEIRLTNIKLNPPMPDDLFVYHNNLEHRLVDETTERENELKRHEEVKRRYGKTIEERMYRELVSSPPFEKARGVRYLKRQDIERFGEPVHGFFANRL